MAWYVEAAGSWCAIPELQLKAEDVGDGTEFKGSWAVVERAQRLLVGDGKRRKGTLGELVCLPPPPANASESVARKYARPGEEEMFRELLVVPVQHAPVRVAKFDVCLREEPLWAVYAMRTILGRIVLFECTVCRERFPTFHPNRESNYGCSAEATPWIQRWIQRRADGTTVNPTLDAAPR